MDIFDIMSRKVYLSALIEGVFGIATFAPQQSEQLQLILAVHSWQSQALLHAIPLIL